jgi:pimeloyl-ACP methyl ester carboxylesterase
VVRTYVRHPFPDLPAYRAKCRLVLETDARPWLGELQCPLLVVSGAFDPVVPASAGRQVAMGVQGAVMCRLPGGHVPHLVRPEVAGRHIMAWLENPASAAQPRPGASHSHG